MVGDCKEGDMGVEGCIGLIASLPIPFGSESLGDRIDEEDDRDRRRYGRGGSEVVGEVRRLTPSLSTAGDMGSGGRPAT